MEWQHDYQIGTGMTYGEWGLPMDIGKSNNNFKDEKPKYLNCEAYGHIAWDCKKLKKEKDTCKCYECGKVGHIVKNCRTKIKKRSIWEEKDIDDKEKEDKWKGFSKNPE